MNIIAQLLCFYGITEYVNEHVFFFCLFVFTFSAIFGFILLSFILLFPKVFVSFPRRDIMGAAPERREVWMNDRDRGRGNSN